MENSKVPYISGELTKILKKVSRSLYLSFSVMPEPVRSHMALAYLLCRAMDTAVDSSGAAPALRLQLLSLMRGLLTPGNAARAEALLKELSAGVKAPAERELLVKSGRLFKLLEGVPPGTAAHFGDLLRGVASGMEMDVRQFSAGAPAALPAAADLEKYCSLVGGAPGLFWARLYRDAIRVSSPAAALPSEEDAAQIGAALQMTNILKDLAANLRAGRCYLPQEDLDIKNLKPADLLSTAAMSRLRDITAKWEGWALDRLDLSESFLASIPKTFPALRAAVIWPVYWAMDTLEEAAHSNLLDPADRPRIKRARVYSTIAGTPTLLLSNTAFSRGYRFRRETLVVSLSAGGGGSL